MKFRSSYHKLMNELIVNPYDSDSHAGEQIDHVSTLLMCVFLRHSQFSVIIIFFSLLIRAQIVSGTSILKTTMCSSKLIMTQDDFILIFHFFSFLPNILEMILTQVWVFVSVLWLMHVARCIISRTCREQSWAKCRICQVNPDRQISLPICLSRSCD